MINQDGVVKIKLGQPPYKHLLLAIRHLPITGWNNERKGVISAFCFLCCLAMNHNYTRRRQNHVEKIAKSDNSWILIYAVAPFRDDECIGKN